MTAKSLFDKIDGLIETILKKLEIATRKNYIEQKKIIEDATAVLWAAASVKPGKDATIGNVVYVSKREAIKYGRLELLNDKIKESTKILRQVDISNIEIDGIKIYETQYNGYAWAYSQGYDLPITGGVKIPLVAQSIYSDFYGAAFDELVKKNLGVFADDLLSTVTRGLNQGFSYQKIAKSLADQFDIAYNRALKIARTEAGRIQSDAYLDSLKLLDELDVPYQKMWLSTIDNRTRHSHQSMDGKYADKDGVFHLSDPTATGPAPRKTGVASQDINCRCTAVTVINGQAPTERRIRGEGIVPFETYTDRLKSGKKIPVSEVRKARSK